jgi:peptide/nickel transport system substrate-binding protein
MENFKKDPDGKIHPYVPELKSLYQKGEITRRQFLRNSTLLGMSAAAAVSFASPLSLGKAWAAGTPKRGGTWKCAMGIKRIDHPARISWTEGANIVRQMSEYLTFTRPDNITTPLLLEKWAASNDLKTWDLFLRKGVTFNNGDKFIADDVMFTMKQWLTKDVGSSMFGLLSYWGGFQNVEKVNDYHVRLHLAEPNIAVPEHLFHYPGFVLHRNFEGDIIKQPVGTGPYVLKEFRDGERAVFTARKDYWQKGADGKPLPYMDSIVYLDMAKDASMAALGAGQVDALFKARPADIIAAKGFPNLSIYGVDTGATYLTRMRVDQAPWDDNRMRTAIKLCQDRKKIMRLAAMDAGILGIDAHISPAHPEWCEKPLPAYNPKKALALVEEYAKEKGLSLPIKVTLTTKNDTQEPEIAQVLKELARPAGIDIQLDITEASKYWSIWTEVPFGITSWSHRPLGIMVLPLAYTKAAIGAWNETHWHDDEFDKHLAEAQKTLNPKERSKIMCKIEDIMQERGPVGISYFYKVWVLCDKKFKNVSAHPSFYHTFTNDMWLES